MHQQSHRGDEEKKGPIYDDVILLRASDKFNKLHVKAGIDGGSTLCKIVFIPKDASLNGETVPIRCVTYENDNFIEALKLMKEQALLPLEGKIHVTGLVTLMPEMIKEILGLDVMPISEMATIGYGPYALINHTDPQDIFLPIPDFKKWEIDMNIFSVVTEHIQQNVKASDERFPALVVYMGSGCMIMSVDEDGVSTIRGSVGMSGKPFMGLCNVILGTVDYNEIMTLAEEGDCTRADLTIGDALRHDPSDHPPLKLPLDMPTFPFSRSAEKTWSREGCTRNDLAASLVGLAVYGVVLSVFTAISATSLNKIYVSGNFFMHELPRKIFHEKLTVCMDGVDLEIFFLKNSQSGAIAAMFIDEDDVPNLLKA